MNARTLALAAACFATIAASGARADTTDDYVKGAMSRLAIPGMAVAVLRDGHIIKEGSYGLASVELGVPVTPDTVFTLASMTKLFTASAITLLVQDGRIALDDSITKLLPQLPAKWSGVTVRHCLSHTSGLPDAISDDVNITMLSGDRDALLRQLAEQGNKRAGTESAYNQTGYVILGMIIEKITGMPYERFVQERILAPAGLAHVSFGDDWAIIPGRSSLYTMLDITPDHAKLLVKDGEPVVRPGKILHYGSKYMPEFMAPAGLANGSLRDLVKWEQVMASGTLLKPASLRLMTTPVKLANGEDGPFGLSFLATRKGPYHIISYGGGAATWRICVPEKHLTVLVLTNLQGSDPETLAMDIAALYEPELSAPLK